jgi:signal transduction histidine kinase
MSVRRALVSAVVVLVSVALSASAALVVLTTALHRTVAGVGQAAQNIVLAEEMRSDLVELERLVRAGATEDELERLLRGLDDRVESAEDSVLGGEGAALVREVQRHLGRVSAGIRASPGSVPRAELDAALGFLRAYAQLHAAAARAEQERAQSWDRVANAWGLASAGLLLLGLAAVVVSIRAYLLTPLLGVANGISRFAHGDRAVRVDERGPKEMREIATAVNDMIARLEQRRDEQLAFLAGVAHDLRNPLSAIRMATQAPSARKATDEPRLQAMLDLVQRQVDRLERIAGDFLDAARIEAGQLELTMDDRDLRDVGRSAVELYASSSAAHRIRLQLPDAPVLVRCDSARLDQVVNNLVSNAIKYSPDGGRIEITLERLGDEAILSVTDEGIGVTREDLLHIFEPFRRGARLKNVVPGLGLGLAMARRIVERHGGRIEVASTPGRGSTFRVMLPVAGRGPVAPRDARGTASPERGSR